MINFFTGMYSYPVKLEKSPDPPFFQSKELYLLPPNAQLPPDLPPEISETRFKGSLGAFLYAYYPLSPEDDPFATCRDMAVPKGVFFTWQNSPLDWIEAGI